MVSCNDPPHDRLYISSTLRIRNRSSKWQKIDCFENIANLPGFAKLSKSIKTMSIFEKVKIFVHSCHENALVIPENEKLIFGKQSFTTEFSHLDTAFWTKIETVLNVWTLTFQFFQKRLKFRFSKLVHAIYVYKEISESSVFETIWSLFYFFLTWSCY